MSEPNQKPEKQRNESPRRSGADRRDGAIETRGFNDKQYIFREGETAEQAFIVRSGTVEIVKKGDAGEVVLGTLGTGGMFGEMALIDDKPRMASARAVGKASVTVISRQLMDRKIAEMDPFARGLTRILMDHVRTMAKSMDGKVA